MRGGNRHRSVVAVIAAAAVFSAGCSGGKGSADPSPSAVASATTTSSTPTTTPSATTPPTTSKPALTPAKAAEAAVLNYFAALNKAVTTMDSANARRLITRNCSCNETLDSIDATRRLGNRIKSAYETIGAVAHDVTATRVEVTYSYNINQNLIVDAKGGVVKKYPTVASGFKELTVVKQGDRWVIDELVTIKTR